MTSVHGQTFPNALLQAQAEEMAPRGTQQQSPADTFPQGTSPTPQLFAGASEQPATSHAVATDLAGSGTGDVGPNAF